MTYINEPLSASAILLLQEIGYDVSRCMTGEDALTAKAMGPGVFISTFSGAALGSDFAVPTDIAEYYLDETFYFSSRCGQDLFAVAETSAGNGIVLMSGSGEMYEGLGGRLRFIGDSPITFFNRLAEWRGAKHAASQAVERLIQLKSAGGDQTCKAVDDLGEGNRRNVLRLLPLLKDADPIVRSHAAYDLGQLFFVHPDLVPALHHSLGDPSDLVRAMGAAALANWACHPFLKEEVKTQLNEAAGQLAGLFLSRYQPESRFAGLAIGNLGDSASTLASQILLALDDPSEAVRWQACAIISGWRAVPAAVIQVLSVLISDPSERVSKIAAMALQKKRLP